MTLSTGESPFPPPMLKTPEQKAGELRDKVVVALRSAEDIIPIHFVEPVQTEEHTCFMNMLGVMPPNLVPEDVAAGVVQDELVLSNTAKGLWRQTILGVIDPREGGSGYAPMAYNYYTKPKPQPTRAGQV